MQIKYLIAIAGLVCLASCNTGKGADPADKTEPIQYEKHEYSIGDILPQHLIRDRAGNSVSIFKENKTNLIIFWASWCLPCRAEIPTLRELFEEIKNNDRINMISVSLDDEQEDWEKELEDLKLPWQQGIALGEHDLLKAKYDFEGIPYILIADEQRKLTKGILGFDKRNEDTLRKYLGLPAAGKKR